MKDGHKKSIVLIGFMGSGKTTVGIKLSYKMRMVVEDTDKMIECKKDMSISDIFASQGESAFRDMETELLKELSEKKTCNIYSVGGGTPIREENRALLKKIGNVVFLRIKPETVFKRLQNDTSRPLLQGDNPMEKIQNLMEQRKSYYEDAADVIIDVDDKSTDEIVNEIVDYVEKH